MVKILDGEGEDESERERAKQVQDENASNISQCGDVHSNV